MRFAVFKGEKNVIDLANRLFRIQGPSSQAATKQAADALLNANPQLQDLSKVPVGSLIIIPDTAPPPSPGEQAIAPGTVPPVSPEEQAIAPGTVHSFVAERVQSAFDSLDQRLTAIETMAAEKIKSGMDRLQTPEMEKALKTTIAQYPDLAAKLPSLDSVAKDAERMLKDLQAAQDSRKQAFTQMRAALASLAKK